MFNSFDIFSGGESSGSNSLSGKKVVQSNTQADESTDVSGSTNVNSISGAATESNPVCSNGVCMVSWKPRRV